MQKSKVIHLLKVLESTEWKKFPKFIQSPFFNSNKSFLPLYHFLSKFYPSFDSPKMTKEHAFKKIFPGKTYNYHIISNLMSGFLTLTEAYLQNLQFQKEAFEKKKYLVKMLAERKSSFDLFQKYNEELIQEVKRRKVKNLDYYQDLRQLNHDLYYHPTTDRQNWGEALLEQMVDNLDLSYIQTKLLYQLELETRDYLFGEQFQPILNTTFLENNKPSFADLSPVGVIYLKILSLIKNEKEVDFQEIKTIFFKHLEFISHQERSIILLHLLNFCIRFINKGKSQFIAESLKLYKLGLQINSFIEENRMAEITYSNIVWAGAQSREFDWTKIFINDYKVYLAEEEREDAYVLSNAFLHFSEGNFSKTIDNLLLHSFEKPLPILKSKTLLLRSYFENFLLDDSYYELLLAHTYSFEKYIRRNRAVSEEKAKIYMDFIQFTRRFASEILEQKISKDLVNFLQENLSLMYKKWFLQKIEDLKNKKKRIFS